MHLFQPVSFLLGVGQIVKFIFSLYKSLFRSMVISYQQKIIQFGLNHSFKEISFVCAFVYLFVFLQPGCRVTGCLNGGSCFFDNDKETFVCSCTLSWHGERCELGRRAINSFQFSCLSYKNNYIKSSNSVNGTLIQLLTSKECKIIIVSFSLKVQTCVPAIHVCMGQRAPTF